MSLKIEFGANQFEGGMWGKRWYGWASREGATKHSRSNPDDYREGPFRIFRFRAWLDGWNLAREMKSR